MQRRKLILLLLTLVAVTGHASSAEVGRAAAETTVPVDCEGDSCQRLPPPPEEPLLGTASLTPEVNPPPHIVKAAKKRASKKHHPRHRAHRGRR